jgi:hypothetical protein
VEPEFGTVTSTTNFEPRQEEARASESAPLTLRLDGWIEARSSVYPSAINEQILRRVDQFAYAAEGSAAVDSPRAKHPGGSQILMTGSV